jgi:hypothetical protein
MNHVDYGFFAGDAIFGIEAIDAENLVGPDALTGFYIVFPAAGCGDLLGVHQERFLLAQGFFGEAALCDIASQQADGMGLFGAAPDGRNAGLKPAPAGREINGEFDLFARALIDDPAEEFGEGVEDFFAQDLTSGAAQEFGAALAKKSFVGSPDAQELTVSIEFEKEFVKGFNQGDKGVKRVAARAAWFPLGKGKDRFGTGIIGGRTGEGVVATRARSRCCMRATLRSF